MNLVRRNRVGLLLVLIGAVLITTGILGGEHNIVFIKASNICMECIGLG